jgi:hypothetical protein
MILDYTMSKGGDINSKKKAKTVKKKQSQKNSSRENRILNRSTNTSIFKYNEKPDFLTRHLITNKLVNENTNKADPDNERFIKKGDTISAYLNPNNKHTTLVDNYFLDNKNHSTKNFKSNAKYLGDFVKNDENDFCKSEISPEFKLHSINQCDVLVVLTRGYKPLFFATLILKIDSLYIDLICSGGELYGGGLLMDFIIKMSENLLYDKLTLSSIKNIDTMTFYNKLNFKYDKTDDPDCVKRDYIDKHYPFSDRNNLCQMTKYLYVPKENPTPTPTPTYIDDSKRRLKTLRKIITAHRQRNKLTAKRRQKTLGKRIRHGNTYKNNVIRMFNKTLGIN